MREQKQCHVAGFPISHSLSPNLFALVHEHLNLKWEMPSKIATSEIDEIFNSRQQNSVSTEFKEMVKKSTESNTGDCFEFQNIPVIDINHKEQDFVGIPQWGSITTPLKHELGVTAANCYTIDERGLRYSMTDGYAVILVAEEFGIDFNSKPVLHLKGGGSASIATAKAWLSMGGQIKAINGKRSLPDDILMKCNSQLSPNLFLDFDESSDSDYLVLFPNYSSKLIFEKGKIDGRWMLIAQHLLAWAVLFSPENADNLPSLDLLFKRLVFLESLINQSF
jgi:hypothetical protein